MRYLKMAKCPECGQDVLRVPKAPGYALCEPDEVQYQEKKNGKITIVRPNGEICRAVFTDDLSKVTGIGYVMHTC